MHRSLAPRGLVAAAVLACPFVLGLRVGIDPGADPIAAAAEPAAGIWHPIGGWEPRWLRFTARDDEDAFADVPEGVLAHTAARMAQDPERGARLERVSVTWMPSGLELWLCEQDPFMITSPDSWVLLVRDPASGAVSRTPGFGSEQWIWGEDPRVRFVDLDGDGRDEIALRQFHHNGTVDNDDLVDFFTVLPDLSLRLDLRHCTDGNDFYSEGEWGAVRSQLLRSTRGGLRSVMWHENREFNVQRTPMGHVDLARDEAGRFRVVARFVEPAMEGDERTAASYLDGSVRHPDERTWAR
jgi:hypothetical protein